MLECIQLLSNHTKPCWAYQSIPDQGC